MDSTSAALLQYSTDNYLHYYHHQSPIFSGNTSSITKTTAGAETGLLRSTTLPVLEIVRSVGVGGLILSSPIPVTNSSLPRPLYPIQPQQQPPLLPLPTTMAAAVSRTRSLHHSLPPISGRRQSPPPAKKKQQIYKGTTNNNNKTNKKSTTTTTNHITKAATVKRGRKTSKSNVKEVDSSQAVRSVTRSLTGRPNVAVNDDDDDEVVFLGIDNLIFAVSPPPSSLPLPKFSLRPKRISCNLQAAASASSTSSVIVDAGATDNLCRILNLR